MNFPLISIIVTTKNEEKNIGRCLESIRKQTFPKDKSNTCISGYLKDFAKTRVSRYHSLSSAVN